MASEGGLKESSGISGIKYGGKLFDSASAALDAYITDFQRSQRDPRASTGKLELPPQDPKPRARNKDVLRTSLTDAELNLMNIPVEPCDLDLLSLTTDDLLAFKTDSSLPLSQTSRVKKVPAGSSRPAEAGKLLTVEDLLTDGLSSSHVPRRISGQTPEKGFSGVTSVPKLKPVWLGQCEDPLVRSSCRTEAPVVSTRRPSKPDISTIGQSRVREPQFLEKPGPGRRQKKASGHFFTDKTKAQIFRSPEPTANSRYLHEVGKLREASVDVLDAERSWEKSAVMFKSPVPVGGADGQRQKLQMSKSPASCLSGNGDGNHPGPVEALKHMLFRLQALEQPTSSTDQSQPRLQVSQLKTGECEMARADESLQRALRHLETLKTLVLDDGEAGAVHDGTAADVT